MLKSMTAFGRASVNTPLGRFVAEIKCVNRKFLDIAVSTQKGLSCFEGDIRAQVSSHIYRGKVDVSLLASFEGTNPVKVTPNLALAVELKKAWKQIAENVGGGAFELRMLENEPGLFIYEESIENVEDYRKLIKEVTESALNEAMLMKKEEGAALQNDIEARLQKLKDFIEKIEQIGDLSVQKYRDKLTQRLAEFLPESAEIDDRLLKEIALFAEKIDISEEITRFHSHLKQFLKYITTESEGVGKTLEFLVQELLRESNTIGSKCQEVEISRINVEIKSEIERIREQVQNVE